MSAEVKQPVLSYGEIAYNAYCACRDWKSVRGEVLPPFTGQSLELQGAWEIAAAAVLREAYRRQS